MLDQSTLIFLFASDDAKNLIENRNYLKKKLIVNRNPINIEIRAISLNLGIILSNLS
jgi:hypothetical protein